MSFVAFHLPYFNNTLFARWRALLPVTVTGGDQFAVESLLSTAGSETGMLEDFEQAVKLLSGFSFRLKPPREQESSSSPPIISGYQPFTDTSAHDTTGIEP